MYSRAAFIFRVVSAIDLEAIMNKYLVGQTNFKVRCIFAASSAVRLYVLKTSTCTSFYNEASYAGFEFIFHFYNVLQDFFFSF